MVSATDRAAINWKSDPTAYSHGALAALVLAISFAGACTEVRARPDWFEGHDAATGDSGPGPCALAGEVGTSCDGSGSCDAECPPEDAGAALRDAGVAVVDAGPPPLDAGGAVPDAGALVPDAGAVVPDAGAVVPDAGALAPDAGAVVPDAGVNLCSPVEDACPPDQVCTLTAPTAAECRPAGTTPLGAACAQEPCMRAGLCADLGAGQRCYSSCDATHACVLGQCQMLGGLPFGLCGGVACSPILDPCPQDQTCSFVAGATGCLPVGTTPIGGACSLSGCQRGGVCAALGPGGPRCWSACDDLRPCAVGTCSPLSGYAFGLCL